VNQNTILIVDDEQSAHETISSILDGLGYRLEKAVNGLEALEKARAVVPDLILLDVMMPGLNGFDVCRSLRGNSLLREVPILLLTALDDRESRLNGLEAGADDYISKPFNSHELRARVKTIIRLNRYRTLLEQREALKDMAARAARMQEEERTRISREIHDDIGEALTLHQIELNLLLDKLSTAPDDLRELLRRLIGDTSKVFSKLQIIAQNLRPPALDALPITEALRAFCADVSNRSMLPIHFDADENIPETADLIKVTLYRVLQESLVNVVRHSNANQSWVTLNFDEEGYCLIIQDNGRGITMEDQKEAGLGLRGMKERVALSGGMFNLHSVPDRGTIITVRFPP